MQTLAPVTRVEYIVTETYQFIITLAVLAGGGYIVITEPSSAATNLVSGFIGVVLTFWFSSRSNPTGGMGGKPGGQLE